MMTRFSGIDRLAFIFLLLAASSCKKNNEIRHTTAPEQKTYQALLQDTLYERGFTVGHVEDGKAGVLSLMSYGGTTTNNPLWNIAQWNNYNNPLSSAVFTNQSPLFRYATEKGNAIVADTQKGAVQLVLNTSSEYGQSEICPVNPRRSGDKWPHLLLSCDLPEDRLLRLAGKQEILMDIDFTIDAVEDKIPPGAFDPALHTAQFQWYITVQNRNQQDEGYGEYFWFGLCYYDTRFNYTAEYAAQDNNTTSMFIYIPDMQVVQAGVGRTSIGKRMKLKTDVLPLIDKAFNLARSRGYMQHTSREELYIATTNIGWEVPGTYNVASTIHRMNIRYR